MDEKVTATSREVEYIHFLEENNCKNQTLLTMTQWLAVNGFFNAPASTKYHGAYEGGLFDHCLFVARALVDLTESLHFLWQRKESPLIVGLFHDLCKCDQYLLKADGTYEFRKDNLFNGHGDKSVFLLSTQMQLTEEEVACIRYHMGAFSDDPNERSAYSRAVRIYPQVLYTHTADMIASQVLGV